MPPASAPNRLATAARWPFGIGITAWTYLWRITPMHRREATGSWDEDAPPPLPDGVERDGIQAPGDGAGPLLHRHYRARIAEAQLGPETLMRRLSADPNQV